MNQHAVRIRIKNVTAFFAPTRPPIPLTYQMIRPHLARPTPIPIKIVTSIDHPFMEYSIRTKALFGVRACACACCQPICAPHARIHLPVQSRHVRISYVGRAHQPEPGRINTGFTCFCFCFLFFFLFLFLFFLPSAELCT